VRQKVRTAGYEQMYDIDFRKKPRGGVRQWWSQAESHQSRYEYTILAPISPSFLLGDEDPQSEGNSFVVTDSGFVVWDVKIPSSGSTLSWSRVGEERPHRRSSATRLEEVDTAPRYLLSKIESESSTREEKRKAVIDCEVTAFPQEQVGTLNRLLRRFIEQYRISEDHEDLVAVGAAIRKYVATMSREDISDLAILLDAEHNASVPIEVELEVTKTLVRRLVMTPPQEPDSEPRLADRLREVAITYLSPRLLSRDKVAAVALNAILSLCLLRSPHINDVCHALNRMSVSWFAELVLRRASQVRKIIFDKFPLTQADRYSEQLTALHGVVAQGDA
jgi:hypothetical protein